jgi:hypothetical protein
MNLQLLYDKVNNLEREGLKHTLCSKNTSHFQDVEIMEKSDLEVELIMSSLYFFYADRVFKGLDTKKRQNWVGIFREKTILCQPIILLASRPQQSTNNLKTFQDNTTLKEYFRVIIYIIQKNQITTTQRYF